MPAISAPRPTSGDVCVLILDDHRYIEGLLRDLRLGVEDRAALRAALSAALVSHSEAEESEVYGRLRKAATPVTGEEVEHGHEEHAEGTAAMLELLDCRGLHTQKFQDALLKLSAYLSHHFAEEEATILGPALTDVPEKTRRDIGARWLAARGELLDSDCGATENVRRIVEADRERGVIPTELPKQPDD